MARERADGATNETEITLGVLNAVEQDSAVTQRSVAAELGIALGLTNAYLKRCMTKGLIKVRQAPPNRYLYYLTPNGFAEKARLTTEYLTSSLKFFRKARMQCTELMEFCAVQNWRRIALYGAGDLAEIATLSVVSDAIEIIGLIDPKCRDRTFAGLEVVADAGALAPLDAAIITALGGGEQAHAALSADLPRERILAPPLLGLGAAGGTSGRSGKRERDDV